MNINPRKEHPPAMSSSRREFIKSNALAFGGIALSSISGSGATPTTASPTKKKILFLGGTNFIGPIFIDELLQRGHSVTLFNRGKTNVHLFPQLEKIKGNRDPLIDNGLKPLEGGRKWDVVIDTCGYFPRIVRASLALLKSRVEQYIYVSTAAVYAPGGNDEDHPLKQLPDENYEGDMPFAYAFRKAACDRAVQQMLPDKATIIRPFVITGPKNPDRVYFTYWPVRIQQGGEILVPGTGADLVQYIDVRDIAEWVAGAIERRHLGAYNMVGPRAKTTFAEYIETCDRVIPGNPQFTWVSEEFLSANDMKGFGKIPMWMPGATRMSAAKAISTGLRYRDLPSLVREELQRYKDGFPGYEVGKSVAASDFTTGGLSREKEAELLRLWHRS